MDIAHSSFGCPRGDKAPSWHRPIIGWGHYRAICIWTQKVYCHYSLAAMTYARERKRQACRQCSLKLSTLRLPWSLVYVKAHVYNTEIEWAEAGFKASSYTTWASLTRYSIKRLRWMWGMGKSNLEINLVICTTQKSHARGVKHHAWHLFVSRASPAAEEFECISKSVNAPSGNSENMLRAVEVPVRESEIGKHRPYSFEAEGRSRAFTERCSRTTQDSHDNSC